MRIRTSPAILSARLACILVALLVLSGNLTSPQLLLAEDAGYHLLKTYRLGGEGGWDYVTLDPSRRRLFVSHGDRVLVVSPDSGVVVDSIMGTEGVHGIAIAPEAGRGFTSNGRLNTLSMFNLASLKILGQIRAGQNPDAIVYDPHSRRVFAFNGRSHDATVVDAATGRVVATIPLSGKPEFAVVDGKGLLYVNIEDKGKIAVISTSDLAVKAAYSLSPGEDPTGLAIDTASSRLFSVCGNKTMVVMNARTGEVIATLAIGAGVDGCAYDPRSGYAFASNGEGTLTVVGRKGSKDYYVAQTASTRRGARTIVFDPVTGHLFLPTASFGPPPKPSADNPRPRSSVLPGSFMLLEMGR